MLAQIVRTKIARDLPRSQTGWQQCSVPQQTTETPRELQNAWWISEAHSYPSFTTEQQA